MKTNRAYTNSSSIGPELMRICHINHAIATEVEIRFQQRSNLSGQIQPDIVKVHQTRTTRLWIVRTAKANIQIADIGQDNALITEVR